MQVVIPQSGVNGDFLVPPGAGFGVPDFPIVRVVAIVNKVAGEADEGGIRVRYGLYQSDSDCWIRRVGVVGIVKAGISVGHEAN
jgi:hypothetical protein